MAKIGYDLQVYLKCINKQYTPQQSTGLDRFLVKPLISAAETQQHQLHIAGWGSSPLSPLNKLER